VALCRGKGVVGIVTLSSDKTARSAVLRMPGVRCALYAAGHCMHEERLNPGLETRWHCSELVRYVAAYDLLMEQGERFSLSMDELGGMWQRRCATMPAPGAGCPAFTPRGGGCKGCGGGGRKQDENGREADDGGAADRPDAAFTDLVAAIGCIYSMDHACVLLMPECEGMCQRFVPRESAPGSACCKK